MVEAKPFSEKALEYLAEIIEEKYCSQNEANVSSLFNTFYSNGWRRY